MDHTAKTEELKDTGYEFLVLLVSILSIFNLIMLLIPGLSAVVKGVVRIMDALTWKKLETCSLNKRRQTLNSGTDLTC